MKVIELIELLSEFDAGAEVILQGDAEGNAYSPLADVWDGAVYVPTSPFDDEVYPTEWSADDAGLTQREWRAIRANPRCVVLAPLA